MRIQFASVEDILAELRLCRSEIVGQTVRWREDRTELDEVRELIGIWITAMTETGFLLELGIDCGIDVQSSGDPAVATAGSARAQAIREDLEVVCSESGLHVRGGKLEY